MSTPNTTAGLTQVAALRLKAGNDLVTNATIYFTPVDNQGRAVSLRDGQASGNQGLHTGDAFQAPVTSGGFTIVVPDVSVSTPAYVGYRIDIESTATGKLLPLPGFACYQPTGLNVDFDAATPNLATQAIIQTGPPGTNGSPGANGQSAYQIALANGFVGTQADWLASMPGRSGASLYPLIGSTVAQSGTCGVSVGAPLGVGVSMLIPEVLAAGWLESVMVRIGTFTAGGHLEIFVCNVVGFHTYQIADSFLVAPAASGVQSFQAGIDYPARQVKAGQVIGVYAPAAGDAQVNFDAGGYSGRSLLYFGGLPSSSPSGTLMSNLDGARAELSATVRVLSAASWISPFAGAGSAGIVPDPGAGSPNRLLQANGHWGTLPSPATIASAGRTILRAEHFAALPTDLTTNATTWTIASGGGMTCATTGALAALETEYACDKRSYFISFLLPATGIRFTTGSYNESIGLDTHVDIDATANTIAFRTGFDPASSSVLSSIALGFSLAINTLYTLQITVDRRQVTLSLPDPVTGTVATLQRGDNTSAAWPDCGMMLDSVMFFTVAGAPIFKQVIVTADQVLPSAVIFGDSITQGYTIAPPARWSQHLADSFGNAVISGRSGCTAADVLRRCTTELPFLQPNYIVVHIGTNDGNLSTWQSNFAAIIAAATAQGIGVVACTVPPTSNDTSHIIPSMNSWLLARTDLVGIIDFARAMTVGNDRVTLNTALFNSDGIHPNMAGQAAMTARALVDIPHLLHGGGGSALTLTTTGSGAATLTGTALNIPTPPALPTSPTFTSVQTQAFQVSDPGAGPTAVGQFLMPNLGAGNFLAVGFGKSITPGNSGFFTWNNTANPFFGVSTYANSSPAAFSGSQVWLNGGPVHVGNANATGGSTLPAAPGLFHVGSANQFYVKSDGSVVVNGKTLVFNSDGTVTWT